MQSLRENAGVVAGAVDQVNVHLEALSARFVARRSVAGYRARAENADSLSRVLEEQGQRYRARELSDAAELSRLNAQLEAQQQQLAEQGVDIVSPFMSLSFLALSVIPSLKITKNLPGGYETTVKFTPSKAGEIRFQCGMGMMSGTIIVK